MDSSNWRLRETGSCLDVALHVQPRARRNEIGGLYNGAIKLKVKASPADDAANRAVVEFFASLLSIPRSRLTIVAGHRSRKKILRIERMSLDRFLDHFSADIRST